MSLFVTKSLVLGTESSIVDKCGNSPIVGYDSPLKNGNVTADYEDSESPASNVKTESTLEWWLSTNAVDTQRINLDTIAGDIDYIGIAGHNLAGAGVQLQNRLTIADAWEDVGTEFVKATNEPIMILFDSSKRHLWSIKIRPFNFIAPRIACIYAGARLTLQRAIYVGHRPSMFDVDTESYIGDPGGGGFGGVIIRKETHNLRFSQTQTTADFVRESIKPWIDDAKTRPFFFSWMPTTYPGEIAFAWTTKNIKPENMSVNGNMRFDVDAKALAPLI